mmetsp:Transcript_8895/g.19558  ORF Transcript_8895/g.19558 Transcript_8895/m.19558 type:complete len:726 (-) Transcript_8895:122-2299(-)|eukprot:CAMPEP_0170581776 /NCGR_PEP_ID=MMETSP0224-20130122/7223_1 /TAXON_ID=285029 /ORGANISM="Togula jolla, Strain CCCM 725" /LENGTH=725 /DNA_ID=CAMNT_0010904941 /DNA_START=94 /DNA_END=2271 /DNA_ORIENTATION=-
MIKNLLSKVGLGGLPGNFGFTVGEKVELPYQSLFELHKGQKRSDGSPVSIFVCAKKDLDSSQLAAAKNAEQVAKSLRHPNVLRSLDSCEVEGGLYLVTEAVVPLLSKEAVPDGDETTASVWGLHQAFDALSFLHASGFTHGLFGPASIFVTSRGDYRLGGFELCRKGADSKTLLDSRQRCGPAIAGWPDPPAALSNGACPAVAVDLWGVAVLAVYVFGSAQSGQRGVDFKVDLTRATQALPLELRKPIADLQAPVAASRPQPVVELLQNQLFTLNPSVIILSFLNSLHIKSAEETSHFFEGLPEMLDQVPFSTQTRQILPELLAAVKFPGQEAAHILPAILKIGAQLSEEEFKDKIAPLVVQLFASPDRAVRFKLLSSLGDMIDHLDESMINDKIFPECVNGFTDSNCPIREATVKSLIFFVPRLRKKTVETRVVKILQKLLTDPEPSIRTNSVICSGRIAGQLPQGLAASTLLATLSCGLRDPFGPCRSASLHTLLATCAIFPPDDLAGKLMPLVCMRLVDPDPTVSSTAFDVLGSLTEHVRQLLVEQREVQAAAMAAGGSTADPSGQSQEQLAGGGGRWGSWVSTVGSAVGTKIIGSMGPKVSASSISLDGPPQPPGVSLPSVEAVPPPASAGSVPPPPSQSHGQQTAPAAPMAVDGGWNEDEFWEEFGDIPEVAEGGTDLQEQPVQPVQSAQPVQPVQPASVKKENGWVDKADEDFWKEFDS